MSDAARLTRVEVAVRPQLADPLGRKTDARIREVLGLDVADVRVVRVYTVEGLDAPAIARVLDGAVLHDPVLHDAYAGAAPGSFDWALEVGFKPGVTDNEGRTAAASIALTLGLATPPAVYTALQYRLVGSLTRQQVQTIADKLLANELIQRVQLKSAAEWAAEPGFPARAARVLGAASDAVHIIPLSTMDDAAMLACSRENVLALSLEEMQAIKAFFQDPAVQAARARQALPADPTDAELECLAQTWSEHCKHKIFNARITYENRAAGSTLEVDSLYKTFIQSTTARLRQAMGEKDYCLSVFKDNAGVVAFTDETNLCIKVETHNSPSALDPYGGALTGIVGVNRDPMGTGLGAEMVANMDVFCFASPFFEGELPPRLLHPRRVLEGVREGVEHGGNKSGVPTINGSIVFHERFLGKPLVFCGTVGMMPKTIQGRPSHEKQARVGDAIVMVGGRIGKDGIHGATFSSEELHEGSPATAVQIGDPITQRKCYDFLMRARDLGLYNAITDNGAGGLSSSVGEMCQDTGGALLDLSKAPLKYDGLAPWEILISEAQERMTLAVPPDRLEGFLSLAREMDVEATALGTYTDSGFFHVVYGQKPVALLPLAFLHDGCPQLQLEAGWDGPAGDAARVDEGEVLALPGHEHGQLLKDMLGRLNICSKEYVVRQYDHEVKGGSVVKPLVGVMCDGPADAAVMRPVLGRMEGLVLSHGICPKFSDLDTYWMTANAIDEAVRNAVAVGADPATLAGVDNFCWCDPVQSDKTPDGRHKLAQLVRANQALAHYCLAYGIPLISGKDSMKNDYTGGASKISIPPTLLFTILGRMEDVRLAVTSDFKRPGERVYLLGLTRPELGGSELADALTVPFRHVPQVDALAARRRYATLHQAMREKLVTACHDCSDGGLAVAAAEMCIGGRLGLRMVLDSVPAVPAAGGRTLDPVQLLYSESASRLLVTVRPEDAPRLEALFAGQHCACIGEVTAEPALHVLSQGETLLCEPVEALAAVWKATLDW
ncbi:MAG: phosphoribosylformylglycinamidine synthase [Desulfovibrio sp.]|nr:phosphoribosylformylglycinamidine synthase [Desulfovibrio sp.]